ncbi:very short patch repair endonuclease [Bradyrhizobium sp. SZCCHNR1045]|uniref:very short patch repair endonuclease n=1 Tax=Bradyrhizobium sp. SZCCHNR1045 TaxID=3057353 RepID=UPI0029167E84|nr:very short patch repair endonuclease [Bradyrhizobium sp. SZCCHNR1045]
MADRITKEQRSANMRAVKSRDTRPELAVRRTLHRLGYRYRLHRRDLPGKPDLVFGPKRKVIFVHGCFWHSHDRDDCPGRGQPKSNTTFWNSKLKRNKERDAEQLAALANSGWEVLTIWECETRDVNLLERRLHNFLQG